MNTFIDDAKRAENRYIVELKRVKLSDYADRGIILRSSNNTVLLACLDDNFYWNGYVMIRTKDITDYRIYDNPDDFLFKAQQELGLYAKCSFTLKCEDIKTVCQEIHTCFPLITVFKEKTEDSCNIGIITRNTAETFSLYEIDTCAKWEKEYRFYYRTISKLEWGGGYENALWQVGRKNLPPELPTQKYQIF